MGEMNNQETDPYASPETGMSLPSSGALAYAHTDGEYLYIHRGFKSKPFCMKTGEPIEGDVSPVRTRLTWIPPWVLIFLITGLIGLIIMVMIQKSERFNFYLCERERKKQNKRKLLIISVLILSTLVLCLPALFSTGFNLSFFSIYLFIVILTLLMSYCTQMFSVKGYRQGYFKLKGVSPEYLKHVKPIVQGVY